MKIFEILDIYEIKFLKQFIQIKKNLKHFESIAKMIKNQKYETNEYLNLKYIRLNYK